MINAGIEIDISVINLFLDSCASKTEFALGIKGYQYAMMKNVCPNEITFGIMVKIYGFSRELHKAFELLDLMEVYEIEPSIIVYTNLIHISFYNRKVRKAELAFKLARNKKIRGDRLLYSKIIDGIMRFHQNKKVMKYVNYAIKDGASLKPETLKKIFKVFGETKELISKCKLLKANRLTEKNFKKDSSNIKFKNRFNEENPKKFKEIMKNRRRIDREKNPKSFSKYGSGVS